MLSKDDIQNIANLVRIDVTDEEKEEFFRDLSSVLDYVSQLKGAEESADVQISEEYGDFNILRNDEWEDNDLEGMGEKLVGAAPAKKDGCIKVRRIMR